MENWFVFSTLFPVKVATLQLVLVLQLQPAVQRLREITVIGETCIAWRVLRRNIIQNLHKYVARLTA